MRLFNRPRREPLPTQNPAWGFWGECAMNGCDASKAWNIAIDEIGTKLRASPSQARTLLDSRLGRHFAESLETLDRFLGDQSADNARALKEEIGATLSDRRWREPFLLGLKEVHALKRGIER